MDALAMLLNTVAGIASSAVLGAAKSVTGVADQKIGKLVKPIQPILVMGLTVFLPAVAARLGIMPPDAAALVDAPTATLVAIVAREIAIRITGKKREP